MTLRERRKAIIELAKSGMPPAGIAPRFNMSRRAVSCILARARRGGIDIPVYWAGGPQASPVFRNVLVHKDVLAKFTDAAQSRGETEVAIVGKIVKALSEEPVLVQNLLEELA